MSIKEDILEQLADDWLQSHGYFTRHNLKFRPAVDAPAYDARMDAVPSDIDVIGLHPQRTGSERVVVVSCKSWQGGFSPQAWLHRFERNKRVAGRDAWKAFRELVHPRWSAAFLDAVEKATGSRRFVYCTAVTRLKGDATIWETCPAFTQALEGNPLRVVTLREMARDVAENLTTSVASSHFGRTLQLLKAAGLPIST